MKKIITLGLTVIIMPLFAQKEIRHPDGSYYRQCSHFEISKPVWQLAKEHPADYSKANEHREAEDGTRRKKYTWQNPNTVSGTAEDPIVQRVQGESETMGTIANFDGSTSLAGFFPLDPTGAVGPNHFVQAVNSNYQVFSKTGTPLTSAISLGALFPHSHNNIGDPIVMYDKFADRWVITEFNYNPSTGEIKEIMLAVSSTGDPTGTYYIYSFIPDAADFADYPKYSIWSDGYYETCNCDNQKVTVYERTKMLNGDTTAGFIVIPSVATPHNIFFCPQTLYADGQLPPYGSPQYLFYFTDDNWGSSFTDQIKIYKITTNWTNKTGTIAPDNSLATQPFNSYFTGGTYDAISQPGTSQKIDALDGFFSYRIPYLKWTGYNIALMCTPVNVGSTSHIIAGIRWYELHQDTTTKAWSIFQQGTYAPADGVSRWNPGISMDMNGSIGLAYSVSDSTSVYPGTRFTGRKICDSLGIMTLAESTAITGLSSNTSNNRWGDYSQTTIDPSDGITFWHTNQYMGASNALKTRIFSFQVGVCVTGVNNLPGKPSPEFFAFQSGNELNIKANNIPTDNKVELALFDNEGKTIDRKMVYPLSNRVETTIGLSGIAKGIYYVRLGSNYFQRVVKVSVQ